ncbi:MAG: excinuclease ABC subunit UvrC, partial [Clostridiales bacterium]|nr:excinuclease ABC subunit UvrC [Clostridiales bacterium]
MFNLQEELKMLPDKPGVYLMKNEKGVIIYVGKAIVLKNRVRSYFQKSTAHNTRITSMIQNISSFEYIITDSEYEALVLECNLIKKYKPRYNVLLKDDRGYPYIKVTMNEEYPQIVFVRKVEKDGAKYFGPFYNMWTVNTTIEGIRKIFPMRLCEKPLIEGKAQRGCINCEIGLCAGPCCGKIGKEEYRQMAQDVCDFLSGKTDYIRRKIENSMHEAADELNFEKAVICRDRLKAFERLNSKQKVATLSEEDFDMISMVKNEMDACVQAFFIRGGRVTGREYFIFDGHGQDDDKEVLSSFIKQFYIESKLLPPKIFTSVDLEGESELISKFLEEINDKKIALAVPQKGDKKKLMEMVTSNAKLTLDNYALKSGNINQEDMKILEEVKDILNLVDIPERIEAYDISNNGDSEIVASMVVFINGRASKKDYRHFKMKTTVTRNDVGSMAETLERRFKRYIEKDEKFLDMPDLILADGGLNQVNAAIKAMKVYNITVPVYGMAKDDKHRTKKLVGNGMDLELSDYIDIWRFISKIQNEAHRFAIEYNRKLTEKRYMRSSLDE